MKNTNMSKDNKYKQHQWKWKHLQSESKYKIINIIWTQLYFINNTSWNTVVFLLVPSNLHKFSNHLQPPSTIITKSMQWMPNEAAVK